LGLGFFSNLISALALVSFVSRTRWGKLVINFHRQSLLKFLTTKTPRAPRKAKRFFWLNPRLKVFRSSWLTALLLVRLFGQTKVRLHCLITLRETLFQFGLILQSRHDHHIFPIFPIHRSGDLVVVRQLQGINNS